MLLYIFVTIVTLGLAFFVTPYERISTYQLSREQLIRRVALTAIFIILFLLSALRMEVGNDYKTYAVTCHEVWVNGYVVTEVGFNALVKLLYHLIGGECYVVVFAFFSFATVYLFLRIFSRFSEDFFMSFLLFMLLGYYFRTFNTVRYYCVLALALYALVFMIQKRHFSFIITVLTAALFHKSVLIVIPAYYIASFMKKRIHYVLMIIAGILLFLGKDVVMWIALKLYPSYKNTEYIKETLHLWDNLPAIAQCFMVLIFCLIFYKKAIEKSEANRIYFNLNVMAMVLLICGYYIPLLTRFTYYLTVPQLLLIPSVLKSIENKNTRFILKMAVVGICITYFVLFLKSASSAGLRVLPYKSWVMEGIKEYPYANEVF